MLKFLTPIVALMVLAGCECTRGKHCSKNKVGSLGQSRKYMLTSGRVSGAGKLEDEYGRILVQDRVFYGYDQYGLTADNKKALDTQAAWLRDNPNISVVISGHCDERGTREYNIGLGERRANSAKRYLTMKGVEGHRIQVISKGKDEPLVFGSTEEAWAENRVALIRPL